MYITAAIPYIRDIINSGHNVRVKKRIRSFTVTKVSEAREQIHIFSNSVSNTVNMNLAFKLVIKNNAKVTMLWNLLYYLWIQNETKRIPCWCFWRVATTILLVFSGLSNIAFTEHHSVTSWILGCSLAFVAAVLFPEAERDESSANMSQSTSVDEILNGRSFI